MHFEKYSNLVKAVLHIHKKQPSFDANIVMQYPHKSDDPDLNIENDMFRFSIFCDEYETALHINVDRDEPGSSKNIIRLRIVDYCNLNNFKPEETFKEDSFCNTSLLHGDEPCMNCIVLNQEKVMLFERSTNRQPININDIESEHFQYSTIKEIPSLEDYYYMRDAYNHFSNFLPQGAGLMIRIKADLKYNNDQFREWAIQKAWGMINLS